VWAKYSPIHAITYVIRGSENALPLYTNSLYLELHCAAYGPNMMCLMLGCSMAEIFSKNKCLHNWLVYVKGLPVGFNHPTANFILLLKKNPYFLAVISFAITVKEICVTCTHIWIFFIIWPTIEKCYIPALYHLSSYKFTKSSSD